MNEMISYCGHCEAYACDTLERFLEMVPHARKQLERVRSRL